MDGRWVNYEGENSLQQTLVEHWDASQWKYQLGPNPQFNILNDVSGSGASDVWACGQYRVCDSCSTQQALIEHYHP